MARPARRTSARKTSGTGVERRGELKKHVGAVHVKGALSLLERKVSNVLLLNAYDELPMAEVFEHEIRLKTLAELSGFDSNDHALLRESLESLARTTITWNLLDAEGQEEWGVSTFLAQAVTRGGVCRYAYAPDLRKKLYNPEIYARINLSVQEQFGSGYALALYENCVRFRRVGSTGWIAIDQWRDMLGVEPGQYEAFKYLNRDVLKPAIDEVNAYSDVRVTMERRLEKRRVVALRFAVAENVQLVLELDGGVARSAAAGLLVPNRPNPRTLAPTTGMLSGPARERLLAFGLTDAQALDVATGFDADRVERNLAYVEAEVARGRAISNVPAFTLGAIRADYGGHGGETPVEREAARRRTADAKADSARSRARVTANVRAETEARAADLHREASARAAANARTASLDMCWNALNADARAAVEAQVLARLQSENAALWLVYERERATSVPVGEGSIALRSLLRAFRDEAMGPSPHQP